MLVLGLVAFMASSFLTSCNKDDDEDHTIRLESYGPMPIARGGELRFIGRNLDKVTAIVLPGNLEITTFGTKTAELLTITVPQEATPGLVKLKTPQGELTAKTPMSFSEPISIASLSPATIKPGSEISIAGDYLNLVKEVIFTDRVTVLQEAFISQSRKEIKLVVPAAAQSGKIAVSNGAEDPIIVYSEASLTVTLPAITEVSPNPVKAGTVLTVTGTNLDLVKTVVLGGNKTLTTFVSHSATEIKVMVPADTKAGKVTVIPASGVQVQSGAELDLVVPEVSVTPLVVKNGGEITVTGTNLDLVSRVIFGGNREGVIRSGGTAEKIVVGIPDNAISGVVRFATLADKEVAGPELTLINPVFSSFSPLSAKANGEITIEGTDLDLVVEVGFAGGVKGNIGNHNASSMKVTVPVGAKTGKITLVARNGTQVPSPVDITITANLPDITSYKEPTAVPGKILTLQGTNLLLIKELVFPGNITATAFGLKTDNVVEVYVPKNVPFGMAQITMITYEGEQGLTPMVFFGGTDPVVDKSLVFNDFDEAGHSLDWDNWSGVSLLVSDGSGISGKYLRGNAQLNAWDWKWIWGCNHDQLPKPSLADASKYVLKVDIRITGNISDEANRFQFRLNGRDSQWIKIGLRNTDGTWSTNGSWITVTFDVANDLKLTGAIGPTGDWGFICQPAAALDFTRFSFDNFRFQLK